MTVVCLTWAVIYFIFNVGFNIYSKERSIEHKLEKLREAHLKKKLEMGKSDIEIDIQDVTNAESMTEFINRKRQQWKDIGIGG